MGDQVNITSSPLVPPILRVPISVLAVMPVQFQGITTLLTFLISLGTHYSICVILGLGHVQSFYWPLPILKYHRFKGKQQKS